MGEGEAGDRELEQRRKAATAKGKEEAEEGEEEAEAAAPTPASSVMRFELLKDEEVDALVKDDVTYSITMLEEALASMSPNMKVPH